MLDTRTTTVEAGDNAPIAAFTSDPGAPVAGQSVVFNAENARGGGSDIVEYRWDLTGNGEFDEVSTTPVVGYTFETAGVQDVRLVVENEVGLTAEEVTQIVVQEDAAPAEASLSLLTVGGEGPEGTVAAESGHVSVLVTNVGDETGSFQVELSIGLGISRTQTTSPIEGGAEQEVTFSDVATNLDPGLYSLDVSVENDSIPGEVTVEQEQAGPGPEPAFTVDLVETNSPVLAGESLTATVNVTNTGDSEETATVTLDVDALDSTTRSLTVGPGESATETLRLRTTAADIGEYNATADVGESETVFTVTVGESGDGDGDPMNGTADEDGTLVTPTLVFLLLVVLLLVGGTYYYVNRGDQSDDEMDPL
ncbi:MAG: PKD domain protein [halophilic archaeon J07HX64]|nr:MAG: PKD domain protein [halophilic archaeon J07HX64]